MTEDHKQNPINPYGQSKLMVERLLIDFAIAYKLPSVIFRYFNAAGADPSAEIGEDHDPETHLIPRVLDAMSGRELYLQIFGDDYPTPDGTCIRDYIHVSDIANAHYLSVEYMMTKMENNFDVFNLGSESGVSVLELINEFERINEVKVNYKVGERRAGDVIKIYSDSTKAKNLLGWQTKYKIEDMVSSAWKWYNNLR
jgi:UDP-glucose 4-epimerase